MVYVKRKNISKKQKFFYIFFIYLFYSISRCEYVNRIYTLIWLHKFVYNMDIKVFLGPAKNGIKLFSYISYFYHILWRFPAVISRLLLPYRILINICTPFIINVKNTIAQLLTVKKETVNMVVWEVMSCNVFTCNYVLNY